MVLCCGGDDEELQKLLMCDNYTIGIKVACHARRQLITQPIVMMDSRADATAILYMMSQ